MTYAFTVALARTPSRAAAAKGRLWVVRSDEVSNEAAVMRLPPGYSLEGGGLGRLVLARADGSAVAAFAFSAFGPTPEAVRDAAEEDRIRRRASGPAGDEEEGRGG